MISARTPSAPVISLRLVPALTAITCSGSSVKLSPAIVHLRRPSQRGVDLLLPVVAVVVLGVAVGVRRDVDHLDAERADPRAPRAPS